MIILGRVTSLRTDFSRYKNYSPDLVFDVDHGVYIKFDIPDDKVNVETMSPETFAEYIMRPWAIALEQENNNRLSKGKPTPTELDQPDY